MTKGSNASRWPLVRSQDKVLWSIKYQRRRSWLPFGALPPQRQRGRCAIARSGRQGAAAISDPETASFTKLWAVANHIFLGSLMVHTGQECHSLRSAPQKRRGTPRKQWLGLGRWIRCRAHMGQCAHRAFSHLSTWTWEEHRMHSLPGSVLLQSTGEPERLRTGKWTKHWVHLGQCPVEHLEPEQCGLGSTRHPGPWQSQCGPVTVSTTHMPAVFVHSVPPSPQQNWANEPK